MKNAKSKWIAGLLAAIGIAIAAAAWAAGNDVARAHDDAAAIVTAPHTATPTPTATPAHDPHAARLIGTHHLVVRDASGRIVATEDVRNLVTTAGKNYLLGAGLAGSTVTTSWYVGMLTEQSHQAVTSCSGTSLVVPSSVTTQTGQYVTIYGATTVATTITTGAASATQTVGSCPSSATVASFGPTLAAADTAASHANWTAIGSASITNSTWPAWTAGSVSAGSVSNSGSPAVITMASSIATTYLHGLFLTSSNALATSSGTLYSEVEFTAGALAVGSSYTITDTYTLSLS